MLLKNITITLLAFGVNITYNYRFSICGDWVTLLLENISLWLMPKFVYAVNLATVFLHLLIITHKH